MTQTHHVNVSRLPWVTARDRALIRVKNKTILLVYHFLKSYADINCLKKIIYEDRILKSRYEKNIPKGRYEKHISKSGYEKHMQQSRYGMLICSPGAKHAGGFGGPQVPQGAQVPHSISI